MHCVGSAPLLARNTQCECEYYSSPHSTHPLCSPTLLHSLTAPPLGSLTLLPHSAHSLTAPPLGSLTLLPHSAHSLCSTQSFYLLTHSLCCSTRLPHSAPLVILFVAHSLCCSTHSLCSVILLAHSLCCSTHSLCSLTLLHSLTLLPHSVVVVVVCLPTPMEGMGRL